MTAAENFPLAATIKTHDALFTQYSLNLLQSYRKLTIDAYIIFIFKSETIRGFKINNEISRRNCVKNKNGHFEV